MQTRTDFFHQLDEIAASLGVFCKKTVGDIRLLATALDGDEEAIESVLSGAKTERRLRAAIEDACFDCMLLQQPVAGDLRFVTGAFRLVSNLAHIDSMCRDVAFLARALPKEETLRLDDELNRAAERVATMVEDAVTAFRTSDADLARGVFAADDEVDAIYQECEDAIINLIKTSETRAKYLPELLMVAKYFERMGDNAVRIADWTVYRVTGQREMAEGE